MRDFITLHIFRAATLLLLLYPSAGAQDSTGVTSGDIGVDRRQLLAVEQGRLAALSGCRDAETFFRYLRVVPAESVCWRLLPFRHPLRRGALRYTSPFGYRRHPVTRRRQLHKGLDIAAAPGSTVYAAGAGQVHRIGYDRYLGYFVRIQHGFGWTSLYGHLSRIETQAGRYLNAGTPIGYSGNTGRTTGPHLHFGVYYHGQAVDGSRYLRLLQEAINKSYP